ncbi:MULTISPECIES: tautomerase family protein [unclassified Bradyrhizobium]|uniref:tautomerase family protein n=1 Tax=unclassified Bradyrhizobium TaxID=2631580 RepID=UPI0028EF2F9A|nr:MULTISPECIES: tautomerase family protein [unclassified Bradyrhizobium]
MAREPPGAGLSQGGRTGRRRPRGARAPRRELGITRLVIRGLDPRIHLFKRRHRFQKMDRRGKPGDDAAETNNREQRMPEITVSMAAGRTDEQKANMMRDITKALVTHLGVDPEAVVIQINEAPLTHKMKGGKTFVERLAEQKK